MTKLMGATEGHITLGVGSYSGLIYVGNSSGWLIHDHTLVVWVWTPRVSRSCSLSHKKVPEAKIKRINNVSVCMSSIHRLIECS